MDCNKRHGTKVIYRDRQDSYKNCIEACGKLLPCKSVDYDIHRKICYYGTHQGEPSIEAPGFASARSMGCAGACGGGGCGGCGGGGSKVSSFILSNQVCSLLPVVNCQCEPPRTPKLRHQLKTHRLSRKTGTLEPMLSKNPSAPSFTAKSRNGTASSTE